MSHVYVVGHQERLKNFSHLLDCIIKNNDSNTIPVELTRVQVALALLMADNQENSANLFQSIITLLKYAVYLAVWIKDNQDSSMANMLINGVQSYKGLLILFDQDDLINLIPLFSESQQPSLKAHMLLGNIAESLELSHQACNYYYQAITEARVELTDIHSPYVRAFTDCDLEVYTRQLKLFFENKYQPDDILVGLGAVEANLFMLSRNLVKGEDYYHRLYGAVENFKNLFQEENPETILNEIPDEILLDFNDVIEPYRDVLESFSILECYCYDALLGKHLGGGAKKKGELVINKLQLINEGTSLVELKVIFDELEKNEKLNKKRLTLGEPKTVMYIKEIKRQINLQSNQIPYCYGLGRILQDLPREQSKNNLRYR